MSCLGVHFALTDQDAAKLHALATDAARLEFLVEDIEERYFDEDKTYVAESDKSWDAMHRALADGTLDENGGTYPLNHAVLEGEQLYGSSDYVMVLKTPAQVRDIAAALDPITEQDFRRRYDAINETSYDGEKSDEDFAYTWDWFQNVRNLYCKAAQESRHVLFTADQ